MSTACRRSSGLAAGMERGAGDEAGVGGWTVAAGDGSVRQPVNRRVINTVKQREKRMIRTHRQPTAIAALSLAGC